MITSTQNPLVKYLRKLQKSKYRHEEGVFLLEGTNLIESACNVGYPLINLCCTPDWLSDHPQLWQDAVNNSQRAEIVSPEVIASIATTVQPDGVIATGKRQEQRSLSIHSLGLILETIQDPGNLGTIIRTSMATDVEGIWLNNHSVDLDNPKVLRSSVGQWFKMPMAISDDLQTKIHSYKEQGFQILATVPDAKLTYWDVDLTAPSIILMGNEGAGLSSELLSLADLQVNIPLNPHVESLNVAIATALILYEVKRQRMWE
jgi:RNA methyltransferase, TrmH family